MNFLLFALIPLILSIGIMPSLSFAETIDSPRKQMKTGTAPEDVVCKSGLALMIRDSGSAVCVKSDSIVKLENRDWNLLKEAKTTTDTSIETIETRIGTLTLESDYLSDETAQKLKDELFFQRAVQVYHLAYPCNN